MPNFRHDLVLTDTCSLFVKYHIFCKTSMHLKLPFKIKIIDFNKDENSFQGETIFHGKKYSIKIHSTIQEKIIKFPFSVIGVTEDKILVRISGPSGIYVEDHMIFKGESKRIEIESDIMYDEISNNQDKLFNILEIFVK